MRNFRIIGFAFAAVLLAGCVGGTKEDAIPVGIRFRPVIGYDTRVMESLPFPEDRTFTVWAQSEQSGALYIEKEEISYENDWSSSQCWPKSALKFEAIWPKEVAISYSPGKGIQISDFDCTDGDVDILLAKAHSDSEVDGKLPLSFNHLLSRVDFRMHNSLAEGNTIRVTKVHLKNFAIKGSYNTIDADSWYAQSYSGARTVYEVSHDDGIAIQPNSTIYIGEDFFAIPQVSLGSLEVFYDVRHGNSEWIPQIAEIENFEIVWEPGQYCTYTLKLLMDKMVSTPGISSWNNRE